MRNWGPCIIRYLEQKTESAVDFEVINAIIMEHLPRGIKEVCSPDTSKTLPIIHPYFTEALFKRVDLLFQLVCGVCVCVCVCVCVVCVCVRVCACVQKSALPSQEKSTFKISLKKKQTVILNSKNISQYCCFLMIK